MERLPQTSNIMPEPVVFEQITEEKANEALMIVENTTIPLNEIAEKMGVSEHTLFQKLHSSPEMIANYARAIEQRCHLEILQGQQDEKECLNTIRNGDIDPKLGNALVQAYRLKADNAKWRATKLYPRIYGDRVEHNITGISKESDQAYNERMAGMAVVPGSGIVEAPPGLLSPTQEARKERTKRDSVRKQANRELAEAVRDAGKAGKDSYDPGDDPGSDVALKDGECQTPDDQAASKASQAPGSPVNPSTTTKSSERTAINNDNSTPDLF